MKFELTIGTDKFCVDPDSGKSIAIGLDFDGPQPNHFGVNPAREEPVKSGKFVGDISLGGTCNVRELHMIPHCQGTHTESVGHIVGERVPIGTIVHPSFMLATLISVEPVVAEGCEDDYTPALADDDLVITSEAIAKAYGDLFRAPVLIVRTLPNDEEKKSRNYSERLPAFFTSDAIELLNEIGIKHLLVDIPSIDRTHDEGLLTNHHLFWNVPEGTSKLTSETWTDKTITELVFVPNAFSDGIYLVNLQIPAFMSDAAPSRPILFEMS